MGFCAHEEAPGARCPLGAWRPDERDAARVDLAQLWGPVGIEEADLDRDLVACSRVA